MNTFRVIAVGALAAQQVAARCNNDCNQHGVCNAGSTCECERGFVGNDCAERVCYSGHAFIDSPLGDINADQTIDTDQQVYFHHTNSPVGEQYDPHYGLARTSNTLEWDEGHFYRECSNKGTCNRATGECECFPGFEGAGCTRQVCPDDCSGHGQCISTEDSNAGYLAWDSSHTQKCVCDPGYTGPSCSLRKCPMGVDPIANVYVNTESIWKIQFNQVNGTVYDDANDRYLPNGPVHWTITYTDEMGDEWTTSAVTSHYQTKCTDTETNSDVTAECISSPFHSDPRSGGNPAVDVTDGVAVATGYYADASFTFHSSFIAEQVNASIQALPNDVGRGSYVWVTHVPKHSNKNYMIYPSFGVPTAPFTQVDQCSEEGSTDCNHETAFSTGASLAVNDAEFRFPYFRELGLEDDLDSKAITNCDAAGLCVFIRLPIAKGTQNIAVSYKYKAEIRSDSSLIGEYHEDVGHSSDSFLVGVSEVGSSRFWSVNTDGTPRIAFDSAVELHACSRRGLCDYESGLCDCFSGYSGYKCDQRSILGY